MFDFTYKSFRDKFILNITMMCIKICFLKYLQEIKKTEITMLFQLYIYGKKHYFPYTIELLLKL